MRSAAFRAVARPRCSPCGTVSSIPAPTRDRNIGRITDAPAIAATYNSSMDRELTRTPEATSEPTPRWSVGGLLIQALARQDFAALADCLDPAVRLLLSSLVGQST